MPNLNWREVALPKQEVVPSQAHREKAVLRLVLTPEQRQELVAELREIYPGDGKAGAGELRVDLQRRWIVFFKAREGDNRLLLAHPASDEWVTTVAVEPQDGCRLIDTLAGLEAGQEAVFGRIISVGTVSNVEVILQLG